MGNCSSLHEISPCRHTIVSQLGWFIPENHLSYLLLQQNELLTASVHFTELLSACILILSTSDQVTNTNPPLTMLHYPKNFQNKTCAFSADCLFGTYGIECRKTCNCKGGICDRETGTCLTLKFFAKIASKLRSEPQAGKSDHRFVAGKAKVQCQVKAWDFFVCIMYSKCKHQIIFKYWVLS